MPALLLHDSHNGIVSQIQVEIQVIIHECTFLLTAFCLLHVPNGCGFGLRIR